MDKSYLELGIGTGPVIEEAILIKHESSESLCRVETVCDYLRLIAAAVIQGIPMVILSCIYIAMFPAYMVQLTIYNSTYSASN